MRAALIACLFLLAWPALAGAEISDPRLIDGPSAEVVGVEDTAMAEDGSGGVVYLHTVGGRKHVFAVPFRGGAWGAPQRIDVGQDFDSSWARIGAGDKGRLIVTWVQEFGVGSDRMFSATLDPGADSFQAPIPIDFNVGEATASYPDLAMNPGGQAYLTYVVVTNVSPTNPPGYVGASIRVARYSNRLWSVLGNPVNRNPAAPLRQATEANGPRIGVDVQGNAVVAWQEPDDEFVDRIWARRLFGATQGIPLLVSPSSWEGAPLRGPADAFALDVAGFGQAAVALRQQPSQGSKLTAPRIFVNEMPDAFGKGADAFKGARLIDGGALPALGLPSVGAEPNGGFVAGFASGFDTALASGDIELVKPLERLDEGGSAVAGEPLVDLAETGASVAVWKELRGSGLVGVQERRSDGVIDPAGLSAPGGGSIEGLRLGGSGLGDAIVAWTQGSGANTQVAAAVVDAPPDPFFVQVPEGWKRQPAVPVHWAAAVNAIGSVTYSVSIDDEPFGKPTRRLFAKLLSRRIGDGRHRIQVFAIDSAGQETGSHSAIVKVDRKPPKVKVKRQGRRLVVSVSDGSRRETAGIKGSAVKIRFGDGDGKKKGGGGTVISRASRKKGAKKPVVKTMRHTYSSPGSYTLTVRAKDRAGNVTEVERKVHVG
ncbi:MAG TPA: PKD domain-containing protein [Solirubrobacterales bacterium]|nr:PKD domain-containing protein [Solirubrobacterales bacterium]